MSRHDKNHKQYCKKGEQNQDTSQSQQLNAKLAEATVPYQVYAQIWEPQTGLKAGTIFPELYRPYESQMC